MRAIVTPGISLVYHALPELGKGFKISLRSGHLGGAEGGRESGSGMSTRLNIYHDCHSLHLIGSSVS